MLAWVQSLMDEFKADPLLDEILINGVSALVKVRGQGSEVARAPFEDALLFERSIQDLAFQNNLRMDPLKPCCGGALFYKEADMKLRWHGILRSACPHGPLFSLRRHRFEAVSSRDFLGFHGEALSVVVEALRANTPIFVGGATGSGKTSFLSAILYEYCKKERIVFLEQYEEILLRSKLWVSLNPIESSRDGEGGVTFDTLFAEVLRMRPDRIVLGEARGKSEGRVLKNALLTGHGGVLCSFHVDKVSRALERLLHLMGSECEKLLFERNPLLLMLRRGAPPQLVCVSFLSDL